MQIAVLKATCLLLSNDVYNYLFLSHLAQHAHGERLKLLPLQHFNEPVSTEKKQKKTQYPFRESIRRYLIYCAGLSALEYRFLVIMHLAVIFPLYTILLL